MLSWTFEPLASTDWPARRVHAQMRNFSLSRGKFAEGSGEGSVVMMNRDLSAQD
jgi:hypothetical protein